MNGVHDLGGMDNLGPLEVEQNEPVFHENWERRIFGMLMSMMAAGYFKTDEIRRETELMPPADYLSAKYYEKWLFSVTNILMEKNVLTREEIEAGKSLRSSGGLVLNPPPLDMMKYAMSNPVPVNLDIDLPKKFNVGDAVIARNINPLHHTRIPRYIRGRRGVIEQYHGIYLLPDTNAHGGPDKPQHIYNVKFSSAELWGDENPANDFIYIDLFDDYMDLAA